MLVSSMVDLGVDSQIIEDGLASLGIEGFEVGFSKVYKNGVYATDFDVKLIDNEKLPYRHLNEVLEIIYRSSLPGSVKEKAEKIFRVAAKGWAKAHNTTIAEVTFHERGAIDSIVDIVSSCICFYEIGADRVIFSPITEGCGTIKYRFGTLSIPCPAVKNIVNDADHLHIVISNNKGEMVTPTGVAIASAMGSLTAPKYFKNMKLRSEGHGTGKREGLGRGYLKACLYIWEARTQISDMPVINGYKRDNITEISL